MVRLKVEACQSQAARTRNFNSTMVRLKVCPARVFVARNVFQFHYGTIKSERYEYRDDDGRYFNSTMVRLKDTSAQGRAGTLFISIPLWYD